MTKRPAYPSSPPIEARLNLPAVLAGLALACVLARAAAVDQAADGDLPCFGVLSEKGIVLYPQEAHAQALNFSWSGPGAFTVDQGNVSCHCMEILRTPTSVPAAPDHAEARVVIHAREPSGDSEVQVWLFGSVDGRKGYVDVAFADGITVHIPYAGRMVTAPPAVP